MYTIKTNNNIIEAVDRYLEENENAASILTFKLLPNSAYFNKLNKFITPIQMYKDNTKIFDGRVIDVAPSMNDDGTFEYEVTCEDRLNYLNDVRVGKWDVHPDDYTPEEDSEEDTEEEIEGAVKNLDPAEIKTSFDVDKMVSLILDTYNSKVDSTKKILKGTVTVTGNVTCQTDRETCLNTLIDKLINKKGGFVKVRESNGSWYLDYTQEPQVTTASNIEIAVNMKNIKKQSTLDSIITRIIPIGKDGLTIKSVNNNVEYVQNNSLVSTYGVVETVVKFDDVTEPSNLLSKAQSMLSTINNDIYSIDCSALDLSTINADITEFEISQSCTLVNSVIGLNQAFRIISKKTPLNEPWNVSLGFSNNPPSAINQSVSNRQAIENINTDITYANDSIRTKVSASGVKTVVTQNADSWKLSIDGKLVGKTYTFDGEGFTLGDTDEGDKAVHTNTYSKWMHSDNEYTMANADGFYRNGRPYHTLMAIGTGISGGSAGTFPQTVTVQLADEFKGKTFKVVAQTVDTRGGVEAETMKRIYLSVSNIDTTNATFQVTGYWTAINASTENEKELQWSYIVIGG